MSPPPVAEKERRDLLTMLRSLAARHLAAHDAEHLAQIGRRIAAPGRG